MSGQWRCTVWTLFRLTIGRLSYGVGPFVLSRKVPGILLRFSCLHCSVTLGPTSVQCKRIRHREYPCLLGSLSPSTPKPTKVSAHHDDVLGSFIEWDGVVQWVPFVSQRRGVNPPTPVVVTLGSSTPYIPTSPPSWPDPRGSEPTPKLKDGQKEDWNLIRKLDTRVKEKVLYSCDLI